MSAPSQFAVRTVFFESGERMPLLVDVGSGLPLFDPCVYACTVLRLKAGSGATIEQALRGVQLLLTFAGDRGINLADRFAEARFLDLHELDDLVRTAYAPRSPAAESEPGERVGPLTAPRRGRSRAKSSGVSAGTVAIRIYYARQYLEWMGQRAAGRICKSLEQRHSYMTRLNEFLQRLRMRTPKTRGHADRLSLTAIQKRELLRVIDPESPDNPWSGEFVRDRNRLIVLWGLGTGLRRGEMLGLRIRLLDFRRQMASIVRRPDDRADPRKHQPNTKTRERAIDIGKELAYWTHEHIVKYRSTLRRAQKHDFLFVAESGEPMSLAALSKVFRVLRDRHPVVGERLSSHVLRHTWNEDFSDVADRANLSDEDEQRARNHAMGWSDTSKTAGQYLKRRTRRQSAEASAEIQRNIIGEKRGSVHDGGN